MEDRLSVTSGSDLDEVVSLHSDDLDGDYGTTPSVKDVRKTNAARHPGLRRQKTVNFGTLHSWDHQNDVELECATFSNPGLLLDDEEGLKNAVEEEEETEEEHLEWIRVLLTLPLCDYVSVFPLSELAGICVQVRLSSPAF